MCRDELLLFGEQEELKHPPKDLEASGIYRHDPLPICLVLHRQQVPHVSGWLPKQESVYMPSIIEREALWQLFQH